MRTYRKFSSTVLILDRLWCLRGQSSWLQIQRSGFDSRRYQIFWEVVDLKRGPLSLVSTTEELFGRKIMGSCLEDREYGRRDSSRWPSGTLYKQKLALTLLKSRSRSIGMVRSRTQATEFSLVLDLGTRWRWVPSFTSRPFQSRGNPFFRYSLDRRLGGPQRNFVQLVEHGYTGFQSPVS
jgi:hypothetical protein